MIIQLDVAALDKLFPEGAEARVHLQHAIIAEAAKRYMKGVPKQQLESSLRRISQETWVEISKELGLILEPGGYYNTFPGRFVALSQEMKTTLEKLIDGQLDGVVQDRVKNLKLEVLIDKYFAERTGKIPSMIHQALKEKILENLVEEGIDEIINAKIKTKINSLIL